MSDYNHDAESFLKAINLTEKESEQVRDTLKQAMSEGSKYSHSVEILEDSELTRKQLAFACVTLSRISVEEGEKSLPEPLKKSLKAILQRLATEKA